MDRERSRVVLPTRSIFLILTGSVIALTIFSVLGYGYSHFDGSNYYLDFLAKKFYIDSEKTAPTWFSASILLFASMLTGIIAAHKFKASDRYWKHWAVLCLGFLFLSFDEAVGIHEEIFDFIAPLIGIKFKHFWVIVVTPIVVAVAIAYLRFLIALPNNVRIEFLIAGGLFLGGALGIETIGGIVAEQHGKASYPYMFFAHIEEIMEMLGIIVFVTSLNRYIGTLRVSLRFSESDERA